MIGEALEAYAGTDWRSVGVPPAVFWPDSLEITVMLANYGVVHRREAQLFRLCGVAPDLDAVCEVAAGLQAEYLTYALVALMRWRVAGSGRGRMRGGRVRLRGRSGLGGSSRSARRLRSTVPGAAPCRR